MAGGSCLSFFLFVRGEAFFIPLFLNTVIESGGASTIEGEEGVVSSPFFFVYGFWNAIRDQRHPGLFPFSLSSIFQINLFFLLGDSLGRAAAVVVNGNFLNPFFFF